MSWHWNKFLIAAGGALFGSYGVKILKSKDMKKAYTQITAATLRMKDEVVKDFTAFGESCSDIAAEANDINEMRAQEEEQKLIENARRILGEAEEKK
ncbi:MAG: hypothetical protein J6E44_00195 [Lachnospiraceae bacterium]|nr:hypothetical protein [Lachnospiraceae bacterium]